MRVACIIQARIGSKRLPGKVQMDIGGWPLIKHVTQRVAASGVEWFLAWPIEGIPEDDVLGRYYRVATDLSLDAIIRVTGDCPLMAPEAIQRVLYSFQTLLYDYVANDIHPTYPNGIGVECFSYPVLEYAYQESHASGDREHVTPFLKRDKTISKLNIRCPINGISDLKLSVDTQNDLDFVRAIDAAGPANFSLAATVEAVRRVQNQDQP